MLFSVRRAERESEVGKNNKKISLIVRDLESFRRKSPMKKTCEEAHHGPINYIGDSGTGVFIEAGKHHVVASLRTCEIRQLRKNLLAHCLFGK